VSVKRRRWDTTQLALCCGRALSDSGRRQLDTQHSLDRLLERVVTCGVDQWIHADVDETDGYKHVVPLARQRYRL